MRHGLHLLGCVLAVVGRDHVLPVESGGSQRVVLHIAGRVGRYAVGLGLGPLPEIHNLRHGCGHASRPVRLVAHGGALGIVGTALVPLGGEHRFYWCPLLGHAIGRRIGGIGHLVFIVGEPGPEIVGEAFGIDMPLGRIAQYRSGAVVAGHDDESTPRIVDQIERRHALRSPALRRGAPGLRYGELTFYGHAVT